MRAIKCLLFLLTALLLRNCRCYSNEINSSNYLTLFHELLNEAKDLNWIDLTNEQISLWYDKYEQKILNGKINLKNSTGNIKIDEKDHLVFMCSSPFQWRKHFYKGLNGYTDYNMNYIPKIWEQLWSKNVTLIFIGDSLMFHMERFFTRDTNKYFGYINNYGATFDKNLYPFNVISVKSMHSTLQSNLVKQSNLVRNGNAKSKSKPKSSNITPKFGSHYRINITNRVNNKSTFIWQVSLTRKDYDCKNNNYHQHILEVIDYVNNIEKKNAIIIPSIGAWYNDINQVKVADKVVKCAAYHPNMNQSFVNLVQTLLTNFENVANKNDSINKVLWLSPLPQHFPWQKNGYFMKDKMDRMGGMVKSKNNRMKQNRDNSTRNICVEIQHDVTSDWRYNVIAEQFAIKSRHNPLYKDRMFFYDRTHYFRYLFDMHTSNTDCTHYCYTPLLLQPLYRILFEMLMQYPVSQTD